MADDDPFADLGRTLENEDDEQDQAEGEIEADLESEGSESTNEASDAADDRTADPITDAAFSYEAAQQRPFYARQETIDEFDAWLNYELERELSERGYQNIVVREMTDALLRTVVQVDLVNEVAERFEEARERAADE